MSTRFFATRPLFAATALAAACLVPATGALAADATADFSLLNGNPNGVWSYGSMLTLGGAFRPFLTATVNPVASPVSGSLDVWHDNIGTLPWVGKAGAAGWSCCNSVTVAANTLTLHPGASNEFAVIRYTSATGGSFAVNAAFWGQDDGSNHGGPGTSTDVHVLTSALGPFNDTVNGFGVPSMKSFSGTVTLAANGTIDFVVGTGGNNYFNDSTGLAATVTAVPEPGPAALLAAGLAVVGMLVRRRALI